MRSDLIKVDSVIFKQRLKECRERKGISQRELAQYLGIPPGSISYYEGGQNIPPLDKVYILADFFGVSIDYLVGRDEYATSLSNLADLSRLLERLTEYEGVSLDTNGSHVTLTINSTRLSNNIDTCETISRSRVYMGEAEYQKVIAAVRRELESEPFSLKTKEPTE